MYRVLLSVFLLVSVFFAGCKTEKNQKTIIVAHRGASHITPENTVASAKMAFEENADITEIDVYLSKDKKIMVIHDKTTKRTTGDEADFNIAETNSVELRKLDVGSWKSAEYAGEKIPFLSEIIDVIPQGKKLFIEVKCSPEIVPYLKKEIDAGGKQEQMEIISFNFEALAEAKKLMPDVPMYLLSITKKDKETGVYPPYDEMLIQRAVNAGFEGLDLYYKPLSKEFVAKAKKAGLKMYVWTVDDADDAKQMVEYGVDGITTNCPEQMRNFLNF